MYELFREGKLDNFDKINIIETIFKEAKLRYKLPISLLQQKNMMKYLRNLCLLENYIMPDYIDMLTASKCMVNNDYGLEVMQGMEYYPYYKEEEGYPTIKLNRDPATNGIEGLLKDKKIKLHKYDNVWRTSFKKIKLAAIITSKPTVTKTLRKIFFFIFFPPYENPPIWFIFHYYTTISNFFQQKKPLLYPL